MLAKRKGISLIIIGVILMIIGVLMMAYASAADNDYEYRIDYFLENGRISQKANTMNSSGIIIIIIGGVLTVVGIVLYATSRNNSVGGTANITRFKGSYKNISGNYAVEFQRDGTCVWEQEGKCYKGTYRNTNTNEWAIYFDGFGEAFRFSLMGEDIFVTGGPINERFFPRK